MANINSFAGTGLHSAQVGGLMTNGAQAGFGNLTLASVGLASNMRLLNGVVAAPSPLPQSTHVRNRGEDSYISDQIFDAAPNNFNIGFEAYDGVLSGFLNKETVVTLGEWNLFGEGGPVDFQNASWLFSRRATSQDVGTTESGYENLLVLSSGGRLEPGNMDWQAIGSILAVALAQPVTVTPFGTTVLSQFGKASIYTMRWFSDFPCSICAFVGNAVIVAIPLGFTPVTAAKTKAYNFLTGAALTVSSISTGAKTATLSAAPASGVPVVVVYEASDI